MRLFFSAYVPKVLMQKTLSRGENVVCGYSVIDSTVQRVKAEGSTRKWDKKAIKMSQWKAVMMAGLQGSCVATYSDGADCQEKGNAARVHIHLPSPTDECACAFFHNELMRLCHIPLATLVDRIRERAKTKSVGDRRKGKPHLKAEAAEESGAADGSKEPLEPSQAVALGFASV